MHTNNKVRRVNAVLQHPDPDKYFMLANLDYAVVGSDEVQILNAKLQESMELSFGVMVYLCMSCVRYNINWQSLENSQHMSVYCSVDMKLKSSK